eukprot:SAG25_NODE_5294_length_676_cov_1.154246_2_plen_63_part_01
MTHPARRPACSRTARPVRAAYEMCTENKALPSLIRVRVKIMGSHTCRILVSSGDGQPHYLHPY